MDTVCGHLGSSATNPCPICVAPKKLFKESTIYPTRTIFSLEQGYLRHEFYTQDESALTGKQLTKLRRDCCSVTRRQLLKIQPCNFIPPALHLIQGLCQDVLKAMEECEPTLVKNFETVYKGLKADKKAWHQHFTGNHTRNLLTGDGPQRISAVMCQNPLRVGFCTLLSLLGKMQALAKGSFLVDEDIKSFKEWSKEYFMTMRFVFPQIAITPKCHILCQHVSQFMEKHRFWGLLSEQSIEALHCKVNGDERRLCCLREREKTLKKILEDSYVRNILFDGNSFDL